MQNLPGKVVAITGAASGIGRSLARQLAGYGCHLALADWDEQSLEDTVNLLGPAGKVSTHKVDVASREQVYQWANDVVQQHGHVDCIINNAGVASMNTIEDFSYEDFNWVFDIVFYGVLYGSKAFLPYLKQRPDAHIVNISSVNGFFPFPRNGPYNCAKHAVKALNQTLIQELKDTPVKVTSVHPGGIRTNIVRNARFSERDTTDDSIKQRIDAFDRMANTSPDKAASVIIKGMLKNRKRLLVGMDAHVMDILCRLMPQGFSDFVGNQHARRLQ